MDCGKNRGDLVLLLYEGKIYVFGALTGFSPMLTSLTFFCYRLGVGKRSFEDQVREEASCFLQLLEKNEDKPYDMAVSELGVFLPIPKSC